MESVVRISKLTVDNFEQLMMTVKELTYEENSKELLDALFVLQEQINMRIHELEQLNVVEAVEVVYSEAFINALANELLVNGKIDYLTTPSNRIIELVELRAEEMRDQMAVVEDIVEEDLIQENVEQNVLEQETESDGLIDEPLNERIVDELAHRFLEKGSLGFLTNPQKRLVDAVNARAGEIKTVESNVDEETEQSVENVEVVEEMFSKELIDSLAQQALENGKITFTSKPSPKLIEAVKIRIKELKQDQLSNEPSVEEDERYDAEYVDFLAQEVVRTGKLNFDDIPPAGLMTAVNNRVIELRAIDAQADSVI